MPRLVVLNGPPGIGKSTLAALLADRHPGTLNLDIDRLYAFVGGWRELEGRTHDVLRPVVHAMAGAHLAQGRDVVVPQLLFRPAEVAALEAVAADAVARFHEVVLVAERDAALSRFARREDDSEFGRYNRALVARVGGDAALSGLYDELMAHLRRRPSAVVVASGEGAVEETYEAVMRALRQAGSDGAVRA